MSAWAVEVWPALVLGAVLFALAALLRPVRGGGCTGHDPRCGQGAAAHTAPGSCDSPACGGCPHHLPAAHGGPR